MLIIGKVLGIALIIGGLLLWLASAMPAPPKLSLNEVEETDIVASPLPAAEDAVILTGIVLYDEHSSAPYIAYELPGGGTRTKQLILNGERGCSPRAGDLPCAGGSTASFPEIPTGSQIQVTGTIIGDQIFVERIEAVGIY